MNNVPVIIGDVVPLSVWLINASYQVSFLPDKQAYFRKLSDEVLAKKPAPSPGSAPSQDPAAILGPFPEKIIFVNDMVPFGFLKGAERTGSSTARLIVPSYQGSAPRTFPGSGNQKRYFGTGWLIGSKHIITNHHVINARDPGDADAADNDFKLQAKSTIVEFDFDADNVDGTMSAVSDLRAASKVLDYAILELAQASERLPLPLFVRELALGNDPFPVNIIQHPGGNSKQIGIRNNLAAKLTDRDLAYFTDTDGGSSGSAVCDDSWRVIALHKAADQTKGEFNFQGKKTAWVNVGTRIDKIVADLKTNHAALWASMAANVIE